MPRRQHASLVFSRYFWLALGLVVCCWCLPGRADVFVDSTPLSKPNTVPGNLVLVPSVEWPTVVTQANDPGKGDSGAVYSTSPIVSCPTGYTGPTSGICTLSVAATGSCEEGYDLSGTSCIATASSVATTTYSCPTNYTPQTGVTASTTCTRSFSASSCTSGDTISGSGTSGVCSRSSTATTTYNCPNGGANGVYNSTTGDTDGTCSSTTANVKLACPTSTYLYFRTADGKCHSSNNNTSTSTANLCTAAPWTTLPTSNGSGKYCTFTSYTSTDSTTTYSCPTNYTPQTGVTASTTCTRSFTASSCSAGNTISGSGTSGVCSGASNPGTTYVCPDGYSASGTITAGTSCSKTASPTYSCPSGTLSESGSGSSKTCVTSQVAATSRTTPYAGYFNSELCYAYFYADEEKNRYFYPVSNTTTDGSGNAYLCDGQTGGTPNQKLWSGNFLNWASMQAIDTFRLALTGGYRVHRPADGSPPSVTITGSDGVSVTKSTSEMPAVTYLEKGNSDRWDNGYTKLRQLTGDVAGATPSATSSFRTRIGALRNQMWFIPNSSGGLGTSESYNNPQAIPLPVTDGSQTTSDGDGPAIPYNPTYNTLPDLVTSSNTNSTPCGTSPTEYGCSIATWNCPSGGANGGSGTTGDTDGTCAPPAVTACTGSTYPYYRSGDKQCHTTNADTTGSSRSTTNLAAACSVAGVTITNANSSTANRTTCTPATYSGDAATYAHPGKDLIYAVSIRVKVCDGTLDTRSLCTKYGSYYKPEGLLQKNARKIRYGLFSYLTETGQQRQGGVMRARQKLIGPVVSGEKPYPDKASRIAGIDNPEWDPATGVFLDNPDVADVTATNANIGNCSSSAPDGSQCVVQYSGVINYLNRFGQILTGQSTLKSFDNLSEMYYTALRYLRGLANISSYSDLTKLASSDLSGSGMLAKYQNADGLPVISDWYKTGANASVTAWTSSTPARSTGTDGDPMLYQCQTSVVLGIGDTHTNNEDDTADLTKDGATTNTQAADGGTWRGYTEFNSGGNGRGNLAGLAYWAHLNDLRTDVPNTEVANKTQGSRRGQVISTFWVDVVEQNDLYAKTTNQFYNATKYGGYNIPVDDWNANGNATRHDAAWFESNRGTWTSATQTVKAETGLGGSGDYYQPSNMYLANNGQKMIDGLNAAFSKIVEDLAGSGASLAANSTKLDTGTTTYQAVYYTGDWRGDVKAFPVSATGTISTTASWEASKRLPAAAARNIVTCTGSGTCSSGVSFKTTTTFDAKNYLCANPAVCGSGEADSLINYLRGASSNTLRLRSTALGDIVNSQPVFSGSPNPNLYNGKNFASAYRAFANNADVRGRKKMIYVAANDGMVHAFSAELASFSATIDSVSTNVQPGQEVFAYLPKAVIKSGLRKVSASDYGDTTNPHQFWNDGELVVADVECATTDCPNAVGGWATVLVGTTGRGPSKAVYALDVTDPTDIQLLWERSSGDGVAGSDYIGQIVGKPVIARVSSTGGWAVLMGNGYNSTQNVPALLQFNITDGALSVYTTSGSADDGLAPPAVWIKDANVSSNVSSEAYAGDLNGNVWGFTLTASGGGSGTKLFIAKDRDGSGFKLQPITAGMMVAKNPADNQVWVFFGTGSFLSSFKATDGLQTWYGLIVQGADKASCSSASSCTPRSSLRQRSIVAESAASNTSLAARAISASTAGDMTGMKGWFIDLKLSGGTEKGERMITPNQFYGYLLVGTSRLPTTGDPCNPSGSGWVMAIYPFTGAPPSTAFFDVNSSGIFTDDRVVAADGTSYVVAGVGFGAIPNNPIFVGHTMMMSFDNATTGSLNIRPTGAGVAARLSWRELVGQ